MSSFPFLSGSDRPLSRAFPNLYGFGGSDPRVSVDGRPKRIKKYTDWNESALVRTGPYFSQINSVLLPPGLELYATCPLKNNYLDISITVLKFLK